MNCKPGDLAILVCEDKGCECNIGAILRVGKAAECDEPGDTRAYWEFSEPTRLLKIFSIEGEVSWDDGTLGVVCDSYLVPFQAPADDAVDESKAWLPPVPLPTIDPSLLPEKESA